MVELFINVVVGASATLIITSSFLFDGIRTRAEKISENLGYLFGCPMCMGVWVGALVAIAYGNDPFKLAMLTSLFSFFIYNVLSLIGSLADFLDTEDENDE